MSDRINRITSARDWPTGYLAAEPAVGHFDISDRCRSGDLSPGTVGDDVGDGQQPEMEVALRAPLAAFY
jgi:hypothetical protein